MTLWKISKFNKTHLHKFKYVLSDAVNLLCKYGGNWTMFRGRSRSPKFGEASGSWSWCTVWAYGILCSVAYRVQKGGKNPPIPFHSLPSYSSPLSLLLLVPLKSSQGSHGALYKASPSQNRTQIEFCAFCPKSDHWWQQFLRFC